MAGSERHDVVIRKAEVGVDDDTVTALIREYLTWACDQLSELAKVDDLLPLVDTLRSAADPTQIHAGLTQFQPPHGQLILAELQGRAVGVGALRRSQPDIAEVKRVYVRPEARHQGIGARIGRRLLEEARNLGMTTVRLDTFREFAETQELIRSNGFLEREPYEESEIPQPLWPYWIFFERQL